MEDVKGSKESKCLTGEMGVKGERWMGGGEIATPGNAPLLCQEFYHAPIKRDKDINTEYTGTQTEPGSINVLLNLHAALSTLEHNIQRVLNIVLVLKVLF